MALTVTTSRPADLGWNKQYFVASGGTLIDLTNALSDVQIDSEVNVERYSVYGTPNQKTQSTSVSYPLQINTAYNTAEFAQFDVWLEASTSYYFVEIDDVATASDRYAQAGSFKLGLYGSEGTTVGPAPTDGLVEAGLNPTPLGEAFSGAAYPFEEDAAGALSLGTVTALKSTDRIWVVLTEVNGASVTLTASVGGTAGAALDVDETKADIYELAKDDAADDGALIVTLAATGLSSSSQVRGYILVGRSVV